MVSIQGLNGVPEPKTERSTRVRGGERAGGTESSSAAGASVRGGERDGVSISSEAQAAAEAGRVMQLSKTQGDIRTERVEAARQRLAEGQYKNRETVAKVAERLIKLLG